MKKIITFAACFVTVTLLILTAIFCVSALRRPDYVTIYNEKII